MLTEQLKTSLHTKLDQLCRINQVPGMALAIEKDGERIFEKYYGYRDVKNQLPVTANTIFGVASVTKSFAALAIMQLMDAGKLSVYDSITDWLPEFNLPNSPYQQEIQIHHLLTHTSGLAGMEAINLARSESILNDPDGKHLRPALFSKPPERPIKTVMGLIKEISEAKEPLLGPPGQVFNYSNESYGMLQEIIERASKQSFLQYMKEKILDPLGMERSMFLTKEMASFSNVTELYATINSEVVHSPVWWDVGNIYTNGSLKSCITDIMKYLDVYRLNGTVNGNKILSEESIQKMTSAHAKMPTGDLYGYGLQVENYRNMKVIGHSGGIKGVSSHVKVIPQKNMTIAVFINLANVNAEKIVNTALAEVLDRKEIVEKSFSNFKVKPSYLKNYTGTYLFGEHQHIKVIAKSNHLILREGSKENVIRPYDTNKFYNEDGEKVAFITNDHGEIIRLFLNKRHFVKI